MADTKISAMPAAAALTGAEVVPVLQTGANVKTTAQAIANLAPAQAQSVYVRNFAGVSPNVTPTVEAIGWDTSNGAGWGFNGTTWIKFFAVIGLLLLSCSFSFAQFPAKVHNSWDTNQNVIPADKNIVRSASSDFSVAPGFATSTLGVLTVGSRTNASFASIVDTYSNAGTYTWTNRPGASKITVWVIGAGGGGGSGGTNVNTQDKAGGGGGGSGGRTFFVAGAAMVSNIVTVIVGAGGSGGTSNISNALGTNGAASYFGNYAYATGGFGGTTSFGAGGNGKFSQGARGSAGSNSTPSPPTVATNLASGGGGGGGGTVANTTTVHDGAAGGSTNFWSVFSILGGAGGKSAGSPLPATGTNIDGLFIQTGAGGGAAVASAFGMAGASATMYGAGGGGGGAAAFAGNMPGAGGNGAPGFIQVITTF